MINLHIQPELVARCILSGRSKETIKNAMRLSATSKLFHEFINSSEFFKGLLQSVGDGYIMLKSSCFKDRYFELRSLCLPKTELFPGAMFGEALVNEDGVEFFSFEEGIEHFKLKEDRELNIITIPENMRGERDPEYFIRFSPFVERSKDYLAINDRSDSYVYVFKPDGKECLAKYKVEQKIAQISIQGNRLFVVSVGATLSVFNLEQPEKEPFKHDLIVNNTSSISICFGKEHLIYLRKGKPVVLSLSCLQELPWKENPLIDGTCYFFPMENDFIEVVFKSLLLCDIAKISFEDGFLQRTMIIEGLALSENLTGLRKDVCFNEDRLIVACEIENATTIFSYDLVTKEKGILPSISQTLEVRPFNPRLLCMAQNIYYLFMSSPNFDNFQSCLTTFTFSKL